MSEHKEFCAVLPHDDILFHFIKLLGERLEAAGFELAMERRDPAGIDVFTYKDKDGRAVSISRKSLPDDKEEFKVTSEWEGLKEVVDATADEFSHEIVDSIRKGIE